jgi:ketosteroid isomerase-like protein
MNRGDLEGWIQAYERAWRTAGTEPLADLFAPDAIYLTGPFQEPVVGLEAIARMWEAEREGPDEEFEMASDPVAVEGAAGVARIEVRYGPPRPQVYRDLWIVTLDEDGRCVRFEEWPFWPPGTRGGYAGGAG